MEKQTITIPYGYKAEIRQEDGKTVIVIDSEEKIRRRVELNKIYFIADFDVERCSWVSVEVHSEHYSELNQRHYDSANYFCTREEAQAFCDDLNKAIKPIFDKAKRGEYDK